MPTYTLTKTDLLNKFKELDKITVYFDRKSALLQYIDDDLKLTGIPRDKIISMFYAFRNVGDWAVNTLQLPKDHKYTLVTEKTIKTNLYILGSRDIQNF